ncbi:MAG: YdeI/OmpD-associated family protein [Hoeflea sp.]|nr:YdeI/OmpD-associated family protein [Hoeflea sp.]
MITDIEDFFTRGCGRCDRFDTPDCSVKQWTAGLAALRRICRDMKLEETVKWAHPCYRHAGRNIAIIGALRGDFRLSFFNAALMKDPDGVLERQGANTQHPDMIRFTRNAQVSEMEATIRAYLEEAMAYADQGLKPPKEQGSFDLPDELVEALDADPELTEAFHALTPGRQKSYVIALSSAKTAQTRIARIARFRDKIMAGKGAMER